MELRKYIMEIVELTSPELLGYIKQNFAQIVLGCWNSSVQMKGQALYLFTKGE